jgi:hypothetical protein
VTRGEQELELVPKGEHELELVTRGELVLELVTGKWRKDDDVSSTFVAKEKQSWAEEDYYCHHRLTIKYSTVQYYTYI